LVNGWGPKTHPWMKALVVAFPQGRVSVRVSGE